MHGKVLTLDVGNTTVDACLWEEGKLSWHRKLRHADIDILQGEEAERVLCSSVRPSVNENLAESLGERIRFIGLADVPIAVDYETKDTLGIDRVINAFGVRELYARDALIVSCGTATVIDLLKGGVFRGGFITAGIGMKLRALYESAEGLPMLEPESLNVSIGRSTREALLGGVLRETKALLRECKSLWGVKEVVITGGEGYLLEDMGVYDPLLSHRAMLKLP